MRRKSSLAASFVTLAALATTVVAARDRSPAVEKGTLAVHEWGTFTSLAGPDGRAIGWQALSGGQDLPCFVDRLPVFAKSTSFGTVRMETPVIYFYATEPVTARVGVRFRQGVVTEWYPKADVTPQTVPRLDPTLISTIDWPKVEIVPSAAPDVRTEPVPSHYYAARATDASPVVVNGQREKFLFYRGVGGFEPPVRATLGADGRVLVQSVAKAPLGDVILFQNRGGSMSYELRTFDGTTGTFATLDRNDESVAPVAELEAILVSHGLYRKEAQAMLATWSDSWFEEGTRVFYIAPRAFVDATLPIAISPAPAAIERVFVGRMEITRPEDLTAVRSALVRGDTAALRRFGRFVAPIAERVMAGEPPDLRQKMGDTLAPLYTAAFAPAPRCE